MNKILISLVMVLILGSLVFAGVQITKEISLASKDKITLESLGINEPIISPCYKLNDDYCEAEVYQEDGITKKIKVNYHYCTSYYFNKTLNDTTNECIKYKTLTQEEIETEVMNKVESRLISIVEHQQARESIISKEELTDEIKVEIK